MADDDSGPPPIRKLRQLVEAAREYVKGMQAPAFYAALSGLEQQLDELLALYTIKTKAERRCKAPWERANEAYDAVVNVSPVSQTFPEIYKQAMKGPLAKKLPRRWQT